MRAGDESTNCRNCDTGIRQGCNIFTGVSAARESVPFGSRPGGSGYCSRQRRRGMRTSVSFPISSTRSHTATRRSACRFNQAVMRRDSLSDTSTVVPRPKKQRRRQNGASPSRRLPTDLRAPRRAPIRIDTILIRFQFRAQMSRKST